MCVYQAEERAGLRCEFTVPSSCVGLVIGKKGANIQRVKEETGEQASDLFLFLLLIQLFSLCNDTGVETIHVDRDSNAVRISGDNADAVARAREMLDMGVGRGGRC